MSIYLGIDFGGTKIAAAAVEVTTGEVFGRQVVPTEAQEGSAAVLQRMAALVTEVCRSAQLPQEKIAGLGVGLPGVTDYEKGVTRFLPNLPGSWPNVPVAATLHELTGYRTRLVNDARAFTLAEANWGAGRGARAVVGMTLGTGIGGGLAFNGQLYWGLEGTGGEIGHQTIDHDGPPCGCGNRGCLEALASGPAITAYGIRAVLQGLTTSIGQLVDHDLNRITPEIIRQAAEAGDQVANEILERVGGYIGTGIANLVTILSPERVVIGGGVARLGDWLLRPARAMLKRRCHSTPLDQIQIVPAALGSDAGILGAAMWACQRDAGEQGG